MNKLNRLFAAFAFAVTAPVLDVQPAEADFFRDATRTMRDVNRMLNEADRMQRNLQRFGEQPAHRNQRSQRMRACEDIRTRQVFIQPRCDRRYEYDLGPVRR